MERHCWTDDPKVQTWAESQGLKNDLQAWDCGRGNRTVCCTECAFHVKQAKAALDAVSDIQILVYYIRTNTSLYHCICSELAKWID